MRNYKYFLGWKDIRCEDFRGKQCKFFEKKTEMMKYLKELLLDEYILNIKIEKLGE